MKQMKLTMLIIFAAALLLTGCSIEHKKVILHTGFAKDEVFRIEQESCSLAEYMMYLTTTQSRYEQVYGDKIWETSLGEVTLEENIKEMVLAQLSQIKAMKLLAEKEQVSLTSEEKTRVREAADVFSETLSGRERELLGADKELVRKMYEEYALANKVYYYIIRDIKPEISDDEARTITVEHILIKTYSLDENGQKVEYDSEAKLDAFHRANTVLKEAKEGTYFNTLVDLYNEDSQSQYSFRQGEMDPAFEMAAFNLGKDEISDLVETEYGYHIIKCLTTFNQEETDANKGKIVERRREEVFGERYTEFAKELIKAVNEKLWKDIAMIQTEEVDTSEFFTIYEEYMGDTFEEMRF